LKLSEHFSRSEFICNCSCGQDTVDVELITVLEDIRNHFDTPVTITSGNRCVYWNDFVGGRPASKHLTGRAADIKVSGITPVQVYAYLCAKYPNRYGIGLYKTFVHIDTRSGMWRQGY